LARDRGDLEQTIAPEPHTGCICWASFRSRGRTRCGDGHHLHPDGFLYLVVALDWFSRRVLSRRLSITIEAAFRVETLNDALAHYGKLDVSTPTMGRVRSRGLYGARSPAMASRSAWTAKAPGATISSSSGYGAPSNTRKYLHAYESVSEANASISRYSSTTATGHTRALTAKRPIRRTSTRCPSAWQPKPAEAPHRSENLF
jgi:putative transposase